MKYPHLLQLVFLLALLATGCATAQALDQKEELGQFLSATHAGELELSMAMVKANPALARAKSEGGITALHNAVYGKPNMVRWLLQQGADPNAQDSRGVGPLHNAAQFDGVDLQVVAALIEGGANVNLPCTVVGYGALHMALGERNRPLARLLVKHGAVDDSNPLFAAIARGDKPGVLEFFSKNPTQAKWLNGPSDFAEQNSQDDLSPLHASVFWGNTDVAATLVANGASLEWLDRHGNTPLHEAVNQIDVAMAKWLLDNGANVNAKSVARDVFRPINGDLTPLHYAVLSGNLVMVELLLACGADVRAQTSMRQTPLDYAAYVNAPISARLLKAGAVYGKGNESGKSSMAIAVQSKNSELLRVLLKAGADANGMSLENMTLLQAAVDQGEPALVKLLLQYGAKLAATGKNGETALHTAAHYDLDGDRRPVALLLLKHSNNVDSPDTKGATPLMIAAHYGRLEWAELLRARGADLNAADKFGRSVLLRASLNPGESYYVTMARWLIRHGARKDTVTAMFEAVLRNDLPALKAILARQPSLLRIRETDYSQTPLEVAIRLNKPETVKLLLDCGADPEVRTVYGSTPLHEAVKGRSLAMFTILLSRGAGIATQNAAGQTPLHLTGWSKPIADFLLAKGAVVDARDNQGRTPLLNILQTDGSAAPSADVLATFIKAGADLNRTDNQGWTPLHKAAYRGWTEPAQLLIAGGAKLDVKDLQGRTPHQLAELMGQSEVAALLKTSGSR